MKKIIYAICFFSLFIIMSGCGTEITREKISKNSPETDHFETLVTVEDTNEITTSENESESIPDDIISNDAPTVSIPDILTAGLTTYTDNDYDIVFTLAYPEGWYMARNVDRDDLDNGVELTWASYPIEQDGDFDDPDNFEEGNYWISFQSKNWNTSSGEKDIWFSTGSYPEGYVESLVQELIDNSEGAISKEDIHYSYNEANINGVRALAEYIQIDNSYEEYPPIALKIYTFDRAESGFCVLTGFVSTDDPFRDEFLALFDKMANTITFSESDKKNHNSKRTDDIAQIAEAINSYKSDHGSYPVPDVASGECLTSDSDIAIDLQEYLPNMPKDPVWEDDSHLCSGDYYYHYYADTEEYLLVSEMEYNGSRDAIDFHMFCNVDLPLIESSSSVDELEAELTSEEKIYVCTEDFVEKPFFIDASSR